jgi:hypothetical protein
VLTKSKWNEVESKIGDVMTVREKKLARKEYLKAVEKLNWKALESNLKTHYEALDWTEISAKLNSALAEMRLDSLQTSYDAVLSELQKIELHTAKKPVPVLPLPDVTTLQLQLVKDRLQLKLDSIKAIRQYKVIDF